MNDVFISYSRRDKVFTQKLYEALKAANRIVWADWDSIPAASDWDAEIKQGIQETNSVLFVLSPEWIKSNECRKELVHAVTMGKRLFPILYLPVDPNEVPPELAKINWVYMRDSDDFDKAFQTLCSAMDTDLDWIKTHTRIQVRALEWEKKSRSASFALRGEDLTEGERFIAGGANKNPIPTSLQSEYILASRKDATKRQRQTLLGVTAALVISIALGIVAFFQRQEAVAQKATAQANLVVAQTARVDAQNKQVLADNNAATAVANAQIALARQLASQAQFIYSTRSSNQMIASLLNIQSMKLFPNTEAANFLNNNNHSPELIYAIDNVEWVEVSPDAKYMVVDVANIAQAWDIATGKEVAHVTHDGSVIDMDFSPDGKYIISSNENIARVWETMTGKVIAQISVGVDSSLAFSPDGKYVVGISSGGDENAVWAWDAMTGREIIHITLDALVRPVAFSPDGKYMVTSGEGAVVSWDMVSGKEIAHMTNDDKGEMLSLGSVMSVALSPDGKYVASDNNRDGSIHVWEAESGKEIARMDPKTSSGYTAFSPNGKYVLFWSEFDSTASIWDAFTGKEVAQMENNGDGVFDAAFSHDGKYVVLGDKNGTARVWETLTGRELARTTHDSPVYSVNFSSDGKYVISISQDKTAHLWKAMTGEEIALLTGVNSVWFGPENKYLLSMSGDDILQVWDVVGGKGNIRMAHGGAIIQVAFSPDGKYVLSGSSPWEIKEDKTAIVWDAASGKQITRIPIFNGWNVAFSPDGKYMVAITLGHTGLWEAMTGKEISLMAYDGRITSVAFSPDGKYVVSNVNDHGTVTIHVAEALTGNEVAQMKHDHSLNVNTSSVMSVALFSPDGKYIASVGDDGTARVWEALTGKEIANMKHDGLVTSVAFSPDSKYVVSGSEEARVWDALTGKEVARMTHDHVTPDGFVWSVAFSPDGKYVVSGSGDRTARVWEALTGKEVARMTHDDIVGSVAFSPDGKYVVSGSDDKTARVWEAMTGKEVTRKTHNGRINSVAFSPDGKYVVSGSEDGAVRIWAWQPEDIIANACATMPRNLTRAEWEQFIGDAMPYQAVCEDLPIEPKVTTTPTISP